ncbi:EAL domain-containing protein [Burkholderia sp. Ac-20345]|uniref:EAL domain-containing protein n=1 Tax=Burkholderia sp. Ac-20345 TaxID=2703891 RepID=UPI00197C8202|nr:EAL domain-containing protein [Burkholderia sp. Ac-20345]MBN3781392.1 EAL domain-containing protein [Burkholderia sp. Ac-20345]
MNVRMHAPVAEPTGAAVRHLQRQHDVAVALTTLRAINAGAAEFVFQPVCDADDCNRVLYYEGLVRLRSENGHGVLFPGQFIPSLERLSLMRHIDGYAVSKVMEHLAAYPGYCLGVNVSALSVGEHAWWEPILADLASMPQVARRLVVEITETARLRGPQAAKFVARLRELGCRIAIDDIGEGHGIETAMTIGTPDIVKVAGSLLKAACESEAGCERFSRLVAIARECAPCVVVEGVETVEMLELARAAGANWLQGRYVGIAERRFADAGVAQSKGWFWPADVVGAQDVLWDAPEWLLEAKATDAFAEPEGAIDWAVQIFERNAAAVLERSVTPALREQVREAYVAGLASGVYGKQSAIALVMRDRLAAVLMWQGRTESMRLLRRVAQSGRHHGRLISEWFVDCSEDVV